MPHVGHSCQVGYGPPLPSNHRSDYIASMVVMRVKLPELLDEREISAYRLVKDSGGRVGLTTIYRLIRKRGHVRYLDTELLDALCDVLKVKPCDLLARDEPPLKQERETRKRRRKEAA